MSQPGWRAHSRSANTSKRLHAVSDAAERLYWRIHRASDPYGTLEADVVSLAMTCVPGLPGWDADKIEAAVGELVEVRLVQAWVHEGCRWLHISGFDDHQPAYFISKRAKRSNPTPPGCTNDGPMPAGTIGYPGGTVARVRAKPEPEPEPIDSSTDATEAAPSTIRPIEVKEIFEHWKQAFRKNGATLLDGNRTQCIKWAIGQYGTARCKQSINGYAADDWSHRKKHHDLTLLFSDAKHFEAGLEMAQALAVKTGASVEPWSAACIGCDKQFQTRGALTCPACR